MEGDLGDDASLLLEGSMVTTEVQVATTLDSTIDEPVTTTILRDVRAIATKFYHVMLPHKSKTLLHDWDLWGPLILSVTLALMLRSSAPDDEKTQVFTGVFFILSCGSVVITINNQLLGGTLSFFQGLCVIGYCVSPLVLACILLRAVSLIVSHIVVRFIVVSAALVWSVMASVGFLASSGPATRKALIVYPALLFYVVIAWLVLNDAPN